MHGVERELCVESFGAVKKRVLFIIVGGSTFGFFRCIGNRLCVVGAVGRICGVCFLTGTGGRRNSMTKIDEKSRIKVFS